MSEKSDIQWTDALPVAFSVARSAKCLHVKPMASVVSEVMVILLCATCAIEAWKERRLGQNTTPDSCPNRIDCRVLNLLRWRPQLALFSYLNSAAVHADGSKSVGSTDVMIEGDRVTPSQAAPAAFLTAQSEPLRIRRQTSRAFSGSVSLRLSVLGSHVDQFLRHRAVHCLGWC